MRRLYRSNSNRIIGGVCGGVAEFVGVDPTLVRLAWVLSGLLGGIGLLGYILAWLIIPRRPEGEAAEIHDFTRRDGGSGSGWAPAGHGARTFGIILIILGGFMLIRNVYPWWGRLGVLTTLWPVAVILVGVWLVLDAVRGDR